MNDEVFQRPSKINEFASVYQNIKFKKWSYMIQHINYIIYNVYHTFI